MPSSAQPDPAATRNGAIGCIAIIVVVLVIAAACSHSGGSSPPAAAPSAQARPNPCYFPAEESTYDGTTRCFPGGELVRVARVVDADTLQLEDGRTVNLAGVKAPPTCAAVTATAYVRDKIEGALANMLSVGNDPQGRPLVYVQYGGWTKNVSYSSDGRPMGLDTDLGSGVATYGWLDMDANAPGNPLFMDTVRNQVDTAKSLKSGMWGAPCVPEPPSPPAEDTPVDPGGGGGSPNVNPHVDVHRDSHHESRFCRHHWWC